MKVPAKPPPIAESEQRAPAPARVEAARVHVLDEEYDERMRAAIAERAMQPVQAKAAFNAGYGDLVAAARENAAAPPVGAAWLRVGAPNDPLEREADQIAERITGASAPSPAIGPAAAPPVQRSCAACAPGAPCAACVQEDRALVQRKQDGASSPTGTIARGDLRDLGPGRALDDATRADLEPRLGHDLGGVRVHTDTASASMARALGARAFTHGSDIYFAEGRYGPETEEGRRLLAHELVHTLQQGHAGAPVAGAAAARVALGGAAQAPRDAWTSAGGREAPSAVVQLDAETSPAPETAKEEPPSLLEQVAAAALDKALDAAVRIVELMPDNVLSGVGPLDTVMPLLKAAAVGFLRRLAAEGGVKVLKAIQTVAEAMKTPEYGIAFLKGFLYGFFVDGLFGLFVLFWDLGQLVVELVQQLSSLGERVASPEVSAILAELLVIAVGLTVQQGLVVTLRARIASGEAVGDVLDFIRLVSGAVRSLARQIGDMAAGKMMEIFSGPTAKVGAILGDIAGKAAGFVTFLLVEGVLTAGGGSALSLVGQGLRKVLSVLGKGVALTADLLRGAAQGIRIGYGALKGWLAALRGSKALSGVGELLDRLFAKLQRLFDALIPQVEVGPKLATAGGPRGVPGMHMTAHEPPGPPRGGGGPSGKDLYPPKAAEAPKATSASPAPAAPVGVTYGENATSKLRSHWGDIQRLAKEHGVQMPVKFKEAGSQIQKFIEDVVRLGETTVGPYKPTGGGWPNALWTKHGNTIIIRSPDGKFVTILDAAGGGAAKNYPGGL